MKFIFLCSQSFEMSFKLHLILALVFMQIRCNFSDISYLSETQKKLSILKWDLLTQQWYFNLRILHLLLIILSQGMQRFYFSESQDAMVLQICHEK